MKKVTESVLLLIRLGRFVYAHLRVCVCVCMCVGGVGGNFYSKSAVLDLEL